ncbi:MAG: hypothetical protein KF802_09265 [Bdellovibrionaceae bacterium]|nr:hypothetical protein [Pseudobdellovibrionaceae bacterium]MBX3033695.1 hypothetical protein [Pseudobdellovibrionaceae bacterium]
MRVLFFLSLLIPALWLASCQHRGAMITETPMGLTEIRRVVVTVIGDPRVMSKNGYELESAYYDRKEKTLERPNDVRERFYTKVTILGDRRPYDIQVQVPVEVRSDRGYETVGEDDRLAQSWAERIKKALHESRDKRNVIDDFKAF